MNILFFFLELPDLLQKVRRLKSSPTPSPSTKPSAVLSTPKPVSPTQGIRRAPLQAITPVAPENENGEEVIQFGSACISAKKLKSNVGSRYSHLVNFIMEEIFTKEEMAECSLTGSKGRTKTEDIKPALDAEKLADIISYTRTQWQVSAEEIKKTVRTKLNSIHKKARKVPTPEDP
ncbi:uncharacterized protein LOC134280279 [Saccostrea cucullata]|uniref:uncharacterized protein LOC134280279 n=1 Tax=Saccostrea cuccullata TaxID=36930 RepID=UPI002ED0DB09